MKRRVLFLITSDPRISPRPAEAVRIAAGLAVWKETEVTICFCAEAASILGGDVEALHNGEIMARHLVILREATANLRALNAGAESDAKVMAEEIFRADSVSVW